MIINPVSPKWVLEDVSSVHTYPETIRHEQTAEFVIIAARGIYFTDMHRRTYIDAGVNKGCCLLGYGQEDMAKALSTAALSSFLPVTPTFCNIQTVDLSDRLLTLVGDEFNVVLFNTSLAETERCMLSVIMKHRIRRNQTPRKLIARFGQISDIDNQAQRNYSPDSLLFSLSERCGATCSISHVSSNINIIDSLSKLIDENTVSNIECFIVHASIFVGKTKNECYESLSAFRHFSKLNDIVFVIDESATAMGRSGDYFWFKQFNVIPDLIIIGSSLTSAYTPSSCLFLTRTFIDNSQRLPSTYTSAQTTVMSAAALACLDILAKEKLLRFVQANSDFFISYLNELFKDSPSLIYIRSIGFYIRISFVNKSDAGTNRVNNDAALQIHKSMMWKGIYVDYCLQSNTLIIAPPLIIKKIELCKLAIALYESIKVYFNE